MSSEDTPIKLTHLDIPPKTPRELEIEAVSNQLRVEIASRIMSASTLTDFLRWHRAAATSTSPEHIAWMWEYGDSPPKADEIFAEYLEPRQNKIAEKEAEIAQELVNQVKDIYPEAGKVAICITEIPVEGLEEIYDYRVLAVFAPGRQIYDPILDPLKIESKFVSQVVYFKPESACVNFACRDLLYTKGNLFFINDASLFEASSSLHLTGGRADYVLGVEGDQVKKQDSEKYLLTALQGGYSNERLVARVSDFLGKQ